MKLLAIDATEDACSAALSIDGSCLVRFEIAPQKHSELILGMMDDLLQEAGVTLSSLDALAFGRGPGSFTGLRIAAGVVQGAALGADLPVVPVSSLAAIAQAAFQQSTTASVVAALDARMGEVYWGLYQLQGGLMRLAGYEAVCKPSAIGLLPEPGWTGAGSGWDAYQVDLEEAMGGWVERMLPGIKVSAEQIALLGVAGFKEGRAVDAALALPVYIRDQVAQKPAAFKL